MNATEALYGFWDWMTQSKAKHLVGGGFHGRNLRLALERFIEENDLPLLEDNWQENVKFPKEYK